jgi:hypothetical protein
LAIVVTVPAELAGDIQSDGSAYCTSSVPVDATKQLAGGLPLRISSTGAVLMFVSIASRRARFTLGEYWTAMMFAPYVVVVE